MGHEWHDRIPFLSKLFFFTLQILLAPPNAPLGVEEIGLHCRWLQKYIAA